MGPLDPHRDRGRGPWHPGRRAADRRLRRGTWRRLGGGDRKPWPPRRALGHPADPDHRRDRGAPERDFRDRRRLAHHQVRFQGKGVPHHPDRSAVFREPRRRGPVHRPDVRRQLVRRRVADRERHADRLCGARHRSGHAVRDLSLRRARAHPRDDRAGARRGRGGADPWRVGVAGVSHRNPAQHPLGAALRRFAEQRPRDGRVRGGRRGVGQDPGPDRHDADHH